MELAWLVVMQIGFRPILKVGPFIAVMFMVPASELFAQVAVRPRFETADQALKSLPASAAPVQDDVAILNDGNAVTNNGDLGEQWIYQAKEKPKTLSASADVSALYTSNVSLTAQDEEQDAYLVGQVAVSWQHGFNHGVGWDLGVQQAFFRYDKFSELSFDSLNIGTGISVAIPALANSLAFVRYNFNRLSTENFGAQLYTSQSLLLGAQKVWQLSSADSLFLGGSAQVNISDPKDLERREYGAYIGYNLAITRSVSCDATYRASLYDYNQENRLDFNQTLSASVRWHPVELLTLSASASGALNRSDESAFDYDLFNTGVSVSLNFQF